MSEQSQVFGFSSAGAKVEGWLRVSGRELRHKYKWHYWDLDTFAFQLSENMAMRRTCLGIFHLPIWRRTRKKLFMSWQHVWKLEVEWLFNVFGFFSYLIHSFWMLVVAISRYNTLFFFLIWWIKRCNRQIFRASEHTVVYSLFCSTSNSRINKSILRPLLFHQASGKEKRKGRGGDWAWKILWNCLWVSISCEISLNFSPWLISFLIPFKVHSLGVVFF